MLAISKARRCCGAASGNAKGAVFGDGGEPTWAQALRAMELSKIVRGTAAVLERYASIPNVSTSSRGWEEPLGRTSANGVRSAWFTSSSSSYQLQLQLSASAVSCQLSMRATYAEIRDRRL